MTSDTENKVHEIVKEAHLADNPTFENLKAVMIRAGNELPQPVSLEAVAYRLAKIGQEYGMSQRAAEAAAGDGFYDFKKEQKRRHETDPDTLALAAAEKAYRYKSADLRRIVHDLAHQGVDHQRIRQKLLGSPPEKDALAAYEDGIAAVDRSFADTPGAELISSEPTLDRLFESLDRLAEPRSRYVPVGLFERLIAILIDTEDGHLPIPEKPYESEIARELQVFRVNPTIKQLKESTIRVACQGDWLNLEIFEILVNAYQSSDQLSQTVLADEESEANKEDKDTNEDARRNLLQIISH